MRLSNIVNLSILALLHVAANPTSTTQSTSSTSILSSTTEASTPQTVPSTQSTSSDATSSSTNNLSSSENPTTSSEFATTPAGQATSSSSTSPESTTRDATSSTDLTTVPGSSTNIPSSATSSAGPTSGSHSTSSEAPTDATSSAPNATSQSILATATSSANVLNSTTVPDQTRNSSATSPANFSGSTPNATSRSNGNSTSNTSSTSSSTWLPPFPQIPDPFASIPPDTADCWISEAMLEQVEIFHVIGVKKNGSMVKISGADAKFDFKSFFHPSQPIQNLLNFPNARILSRKVTTASVSQTFTSTPDPAANGSTTVTPTPSFNSPDNITFVDGITVARDWDRQLFHFLVPDRAFRYYVLFYDNYLNLTNGGKEDFAIKRAGMLTRSRNLTEPYTCHYNIEKRASVCVSIIDKIVTVGHYPLNRQLQIRENRFSLPNYLSFDSFHSYADSDGFDYILIHHKGQWIYRINYQRYLENGHMFFKVFHLLTHSETFHFDDFEHADENGLVTRYTNRNGAYRYYYSLFSEISGLKTFCVHDKRVNGTIMILGRPRQPPEQGITARLRQIAQIDGTPDGLEFPTMLRVLFYCALIYFTIFLGTQMVPNRRVRIWRESRRAEREIQRLAPVIETIMGRVHAFLESRKVANRENIDLD
ncbi:unnamed protein product [Caenorhabditis sp. 36 PRJEB53466]|nr:unnamed protein product [Caenorhabditis sp. 36 PRJEB53466]